MRQVTLPPAKPGSGQLELYKGESDKRTTASSADAAYAAHTNVNKRLIMSQHKDLAASTGVIPAKTLSGKSLGSLGEYSMDWNKADLCEVSSLPKVPAYQLPAGMNPDPASPVTIGQLMYELKASMLRVDHSVEVNFLHTPILCILPSYRHSTSPRDSGRVACYPA